VVKEGVKRVEGIARLQDNLLEIPKTFAKLVTYISYIITI